MPLRDHSTPPEQGQAQRIVLALVPWLVLALGLGATLAFWRHTELQAVRAREATLDQALGQVKDGITQRLREDEQFMEGAAALQAASPKGVADLWALHLMARAQARGLAFLAFVPESGPAQVRPESAAESIAGPRGLLAQPRVRQLLAQASAAGTVAASGRMDLPEGQGSGYLLAQQGSGGWVVAAFRGKEAFRALFGSRPVPDLQVRLYDRPGQPGGGLLYDRELGDRTQPIPQGPTFREAAVPFGGHEWVAVIGMVPDSGETPAVPPQVLFGTGATLLCFLLTFLLSRGHGRLDDLARRLRESEEGFRAVTETASCAIILFSDNIEYINPAGAQMMGYTPAELAGKHRLEFVHPLDREWMARRWESRRRGEDVPNRYEFRVLTREGETRWMDLSVTAVSLQGRRYGLGTALDVTDRIRAGEEMLGMERRLLDAQKLESLGLLAGGIAHDFNNLLAVIQGNAGLLREESLDREMTEACLLKIEDTCKRAADLVHQMLAYSGRGQFQVRPMDLNRELREILHLLEVSLPKGATIALELEGGLPAMQGDPSQVQQVVLNLVTNAAEALRDQAGHIKVRTALRELDLDDISSLRAAEAMHPGRFLELEVEDDGQGMDEDTQRRIFDPFFTTKFTGRGLGLAAMQGIVRGHQGGVGLVSVAGRGTRFRIYFPALAQPLELLPEPELEGPQRFEGLALVAEDEPAVRDLLRTFLEGAGFQVLPALDGLEALDLFQVHGDQLALVVLDRTMPRLGGVEALSRMHLVRPDLPALLVSGWGAEEAPEGVACLAKPFTRQGLMAGAARALARPEAVREGGG